MSKEQLAGLVCHIGECAHDGVAYGPDLRDWHERLSAILATLPEPGVVTEEVVEPVAKLVNRVDDDGGKTTTFIRPTALGMDLPIGEYPLYLAAAAKGVGK